MVGGETVEAVPPLRRGRGLGGGIGEAVVWVPQMAAALSEELFEGEALPHPRRGVLPAGLWREALPQLALFGREVRRASEPFQVVGEGREGLGGGVARGGAAGTL